MSSDTFTVTSADLNAALLQAIIIFGLALLCAFLYRRYRNPQFGWWALSWLIYLLRVGAITTFMVTRSREWLFWHQVTTGWTGLALLWAALVFSRQARFRWGYSFALLFPLVWSYVAIYRMENFLLAALPAVLFLSLVTLWTGLILLAHWRRTRTAGSLVLGISMLLWGLHHLDYPFLRARGAWTPWGYYLDILFVLAAAAGMFMLVAAELQRGLAARSAELQRLSVRMIQQHEEERRRVSLELHDETAQVFSALKLQLGVLRERADPQLGERFERLVELVDEGLHGIRSVTQDLRPSLLDDLGLVPALRSLASEFQGRTGVALQLNAPAAALPPLKQDAELALFRALQEALSNVARHSGARRVAVRVALDDGGIALSVSDDGKGFGGAVAWDRLESGGHLGLAGMRERIGVVGGSVHVAEAAGGGARVDIWVPAER